MHAHTIYAPELLRCPFYCSTWAGRKRRTQRERDRERETEINFDFDYDDVDDDDVSHKTALTTFVYIE